MITPETKVLVTGCGGMLGEAVYEHFKGICKLFPTDIDLNEPWLEYLDVTDYARVKEKIQQIKPDYILHLAALTDMEYCERNPTEGYKVNALGTENVALLCHEFHIPMVYISTAGVFDGKQEKYTDYDLPNPLSVYGKSKYAGEKFVKEYLSQHFIFRPGWMVGGGPKKDKKFINKMIKQIQDGKKELFVVDDKFGTPTYTYDFAKVIHAALDLNHPGLYHAVCTGSGSRYDVAQQILECKNLQNSITLHKVDSSHFLRDYFAPRPASENLLNIKLQLKGIHIARDWRVCLKEYLEKYDWKI